MSDRMTPIPFPELMNWIFSEHKKGTLFGTHKPYHADKDKRYELFGGHMETPVGPAAGPHTQLAQNIIAAYYTGARFFELKTVQKIDGEDLPVSKPCIKADDECYNVEWSTELTVQQAFDEYVKAYYAIKIIAKEWELGSPDGFIFNMSVGYDLDGIRLPKLDAYIEGMKEAKDTKSYEVCRSYMLAHLDEFHNITEADIDGFGTEISNSVTLSTLHGCPPEEIERIADYLLTKKHVHTFVKCNPTLLGYDYARKILDEMGYDYVAFTDFHFKDDLQYADALPMLGRLTETAKREKREFGVKITNTFPVDIKAGELPGEEMYMSGKSLFPLSMSVAGNLARDIDGIRISYSGGADAFNITDITDCGIWPVTMATTLLKPGGYDRFAQIAGSFTEHPVEKFDGVDAKKTCALVEKCKTDKNHVKGMKPTPVRKNRMQVPLVDCFIAPCEEQCPIHQDVTSYMKLVGAGNYEEALRVILDKNPLPFMTGTLCAHTCMTKCTRNYYDTPVNIRNAKLIAARGGYDAVMKTLHAPMEESGKTAAIIGGGPAGLSAAYFLQRGGVKVTIYEKEEKAGGTVRYIIPGFRMEHSEIDKDIEIIKRMGVNIRTNTAVTDIDALKHEYDYVLLAVGASDAGILKLENAETYGALEFLSDFRETEGNINLGRHVIVIGGGNTAMDVARAAKRNKGVETVSIVYRRTKRYMPADEEELVMAVEDGIQFAELLSPVRMEDDTLVCNKMKLGDYDESGRRSVLATEDVVKLPCDCVIAAVGEKVPSDYYRKSGLVLTDRGLPEINSESMESSLENVFVIGDGAKGPATIVEGIRDGKLAAETILSRAYDRSFMTMKDAESIYAMRGYLMEATNDNTDTYRCLNCNSICENCVEVCPNRANITVLVPNAKRIGIKEHQIVHMDKMCNECGNCKSFCPYDSAPYLDKFTLFDNEKDMNDSRNHGFTITDREAGRAKVRIADRVYDYQTGGDVGNIGYSIAAIIDAVIKDYDYMISTK